MQYEHICAVDADVAAASITSERHGSQLVELMFSHKLPFSRKDSVIPSTSSLYSTVDTFEW